MTAKEIVSALENQSFAIDELYLIRATAHDAYHHMLRQRNAQMASCDPRELLPDNWGLYSASDCSAKDELDKAGVQLVNAIRSGDMDRIKASMRNIRAIQQRFASVGADDTEGREKLWELVKKTCMGTSFDAHALWECIYS